MKPSSTASTDVSDQANPASIRPILHIICERDVGLFNLVLGVIPHTYWALAEGRIPIVYYGRNNCYWTGGGYRDRDTVWEYYFEPLISDYPAARIPPYVAEAINENSTPEKRGSLGYFVDEFAFVSHHAAWHVEANGEGLRGPRTRKVASAKLRELTSSIVRSHIRPREYIVKRADAFFKTHLAGRYLIGVHIRGTDAPIDATRHVKQAGVDFGKYFSALRRLLRDHPDALIFIASDEQASVDRIRDAFPNAIAFDSIRHRSGEVVGRGPGGGIMPAYLTGNPDVAAKNGEEAVIEYLLLCRCNHLVHNLSSIPRMVLLTNPYIGETNTDMPPPHRRAIAALGRAIPILQRRLKLVGDTLQGQPITSWYALLRGLSISKKAARQRRMP